MNMGTLTSFGLMVAALKGIRMIGAIIRVPAIKVHGVIVEIMESDQEANLLELSLHHVGNGNQYGR